MSSLGANILILGASGLTGYEIVKTLSLASFPVRVTYREQSELIRLRELAVEDYPADFQDVESLKRAMDGIERAFVILPVVPQMAEWNRNVVEAAKASNVSHLIRISNMATGPDLGSQVAAMHYESDEEFKASGCLYTILKTANYYQNMFYSALTIVRNSNFALPLGNASVAQIDVRDVARAGAHTLIDNGHENKEYLLTGPESMTMHMVARRLSRCLNKEIRYIAVEPVAATQVFKDQGLPEWPAQAIGSMFTEYGSGKYKFATQDFSAITNEQPRNIDSFFADYREVFLRERSISLRSR